MRSKFLGKNYDGWNVIDMVNTKGGHKSFILAKKNGSDVDTMTLRDNKVGHLESGKTSMSEIQQGKEYQVDHNIRKHQNSIKKF